jgi:hypothetical protein
MPKCPFFLFWPEICHTPFETFGVKLLNHRFQPHFCPGRRSRPVQRGAPERQTSNKRHYLAAMIRLQPRRAVLLGTFKA